MRGSATTQRETAGGYHDSRVAINPRTLSALGLAVSLLASCAPGAVTINNYYGEGAPPVPTRGFGEVAPTPIPQGKTPTPENPGANQCGLFEYFARDIVSSIPNLNVNEVGRQLTDIAGKIPDSVPFDAKACYGLIPNPATGDVIAQDGPVKWNSPEGGFAYVSTGNVKIKFGQNQYELPYKKNNVHLAFVVGKQNDFTPEDLNTTLQLSNYPAGHMYVNLASPQQGQEYPRREIVDKAWFAQQLWWAARSGSNCGVGCEYTITVSFIDAQTGKMQQFTVDPKNFNWK